MARPRRSKWQKRTNGTLQELDFRVTMLGLAFLIISLLFGASPMMNMVARGLSFPGWMLLTAGLVMLDIVYARKNSSPASPPSGQDAPLAKASATTHRDKRDLVETIFSHAPAKANDRTKELLADKNRLRIDVRIAYGKSELQPQQTK